MRYLFPKSPQFQSKLSASNACMLATFFMSDVVLDVVFDAVLDAVHNVVSDVVH